MSKFIVLNYYNDNVTASMHRQYTTNKKPSKGKLSYKLSMELTRSVSDVPNTYFKNSVRR